PGRLARAAGAGAAHAAVGTRLAAQSPGDAGQLGRPLGQARLRPYRIGGQRRVDGPADARVLHRVHELLTRQGALAVGSFVERGGGGVCVTWMPDRYTSK